MIFGSALEVLNINAIENQNLSLLPETEISIIIKNDPMLITNPGLKVDYFNNDHLH